MVTAPARFRACFTEDYLNHCLNISFMVCTTQQPATEREHFYTSDVDRNTNSLDRGMSDTGQSSDVCPAAQSPTRVAWLVFQTLHFAFSIMLHMV